MTTPEPGSAPPRIEFTPPRSRNNSARAVVINTVTSYGTLFVGGAVGLITTPILLHHLGATRFGVWSLILSVVAYLGLLEAGMGAATTNEIAASEADGAGALTAITASSVALFSLVALLTVFVSIPLAIVFPSVFGISHRLSQASSIAFLLAGAGQAAGSLNIGFFAALMGSGRLYLASLTGAVVSILATVAQAGIVLSGGGLVPLAVVQLVSAVVATVICWLQARHHLKAASFDPRRSRKPAVRSLLRIGSHNAVSNIAGTLAFGTDLVLVGLLLGPAASASYAIALKGYGFLQQCATSAARALGPSHAHRLAYLDRERQFDLLSLTIAVTLGIALVAGISVGLYAHDLLHIWLGAVPHGASRVLVLLCVVLILQGPGYSTFVYMQATRRSGEAMRVIVLSAIVNVGLSIVFTVTLGLVGPALGSLVAASIFDAGVYPLMACRSLGQPWHALGRRAILPLFVPTLVLTGILVLGRVIDPTSILPLIAAIAAYLLLMVRVPFARQIVASVRG